MWMNLAVAISAALAAQQTDTTFAVPANARLVLRNVQGVVDVRTWERGEVRARVDHGSRDRLSVLASGGTVTLRVDSRHGGPAIANYDLTVPRSMSVEIGGIGVTSTLTDVGGDVRVQSVEGSITLRGGNGVVDLHSVEGDVTVERARGKLSLATVDGYIQVRDAEGDIAVHAVDGDITVTGVRSTNVDAATVDGDIEYEGTIEDGGRYSFSTHDGDLRVALPAGANARVSVATFDGEFTSTCPIRFDGPIQGRRFSFTLGSGKALVELESFDGFIELVQPVGSCR